MFNKLKNTFGWVGAIIVLVGHALKLRLIKVGLIDFNNTSIKFRPYTGDFATIRQVIWDQEYNLDLPSSPQYIVDLGANIGISSLALAHKFPNAKIIALEPDKKNFELLTYNTSQHQNITKLNKAISHVNELVSLENPSGETNSFVFKNTGETTNTNMIEAVSINSLIESYDMPRINLIKIDIEGVEREVFLQGDTEWIHKVDFISIEFHDEEVEKSITNLLTTLNFSQSEKGEKKLFKNTQV